MLTMARRMLLWVFLRECAQRHPSIVVLAQETKGGGAARNAALDVACGDYLAFLDADDYFEPDMLEEMVAALRGADADVTVCQRFSMMLQLGSVGLLSGFAALNSSPTISPFLQSPRRISSSTLLPTLLGARFSVAISLRVNIFVSRRSGGPTTFCSYVVRLPSRSASSRFRSAWSRIEPAGRRTARRLMIARRFASIKHISL